MRVLWEATEHYEEGIERGIQLAAASLPREHLLRLTGIYVYDTDPKGARLGVYVRDHLGARIELFLQPHLPAVEHLDERIRLYALVLHLAHTLFHEVGHHVTLTLNPRKKPSKKRDAVTDTLEKWAEEYVAKRMAKFKEALQGANTQTPEMQPEM